MKKAICFGTNYVGTPNELNWCVKDAKDWSAFFFGLGFNVNTVLGTDVTTVKFKELFNDTVVNASSGDILALTYSGHGTRQYNRAEEDYYDEALYLEDGLLIDDEIGEILDKLPENVDIFIFFDSCHSQGMMRLLGGTKRGKIKYVPPAFVIPGAKLRKKLRGETVGNEVYISGCQSGEYSYDANDLKNGTATYYALNTYRKETMFIDWYNRIREHLPSAQYPQTPMLECKEENKDKIAFIQVATGINDYTIDSEHPLTVVLSFWQRLWAWIKKLFGYK